VLEFVAEYPFLTFAGLAAMCGLGFILRSRARYGWRRRTVGLASLAILAVLLFWAFNWLMWYFFIPPGWGLTS